jgi:hypothetical protein
MLSFYLSVSPFVVVLGIELRASLIARQALYHLSQSIYHGL